MDMNMKVNELTQLNQVGETQKAVQGDGSFKFTLSSAITDAQLQAKVESLMMDITTQEMWRGATKTAISGLWVAPTMLSNRRATASVRLRLRVR